MVFHIRKNVIMSLRQAICSWKWMYFDSEYRLSFIEDLTQLASITFSIWLQSFNINTDFI